jgi:hypothetical protein
MPGNIIIANCDCGYETLLYPGYNDFIHQRAVIAYSKDKTDIDTFDEKTIENNNLEIVKDPFLYSDDDNDFIDELDADNISEDQMERLKAIILNKDEKKGIWCPKCNNYTLRLNIRGNWD